jgi:eukaryotic-like serine/threonine-protein kinase
MTDLARLSAALADRYRIERELGRGGMATVYLAHDIRHDRDVAIKVLHEDLGATLGPERFLAEIKTTAKLQHPHILPLLDSGAAGGLLFYVMPYVAGETLRERLTRDTQLPIDDAVRLAREIADALGAAHAHGVVHRDIKPENILLQGGHALVADFGIALAVQQAGGQRMTQTGLSLGTPQYMAPEQAMGEKTIDHRADIYALGAVTYEMLTGDPPFTGSSIQAIVAKVLSAEPQRLTLTRKTIPPNVEAAVLVALAKLPADRFASASEFAAALSGARIASTPFAVPSPHTAGLSKRLPVALTGWLSAVVLAGMLGWRTLGVPSVEPARSIRFAFSPGDVDRNAIGLDISPDGQRIALPRVQGRDGTVSPAVRDLGALDPVRLTGSGERPRFSPSGRWIAYREDGRLLRVPSAGGTPTIITDDCPDGSAWIDEASLICTTGKWALGRVPSAGGSPEVLAVPDTSAGEVALWTPDVLPGGQAVVFTSYRRPVTRIEAYDLQSRKRHVLVENAAMARYARSGHLLFVRDNALFAIRFDPKTLRTSGAAVPVLEDVESRPFDAIAGFAIADNGTLVAIRHSEWISPRRLVLVDRQGVEQPTVSAPGEYAFPRLSPDQSKVVVTVTTAGHRDLWIYDLRRAGLAQLTRSATGSAFRGIWTPNGREVLFTRETPSYDVYRVSADGSTPPAAVVSSVKDKYPAAVSLDGTHVVFGEEWAGAARVMVAPLDGSARGRSVTDSSIHSLDPALSPDGRWIAYNEGPSASQRSIVVRRADGTGAKLQVSAMGGSLMPRWSKGGREIVFRRRNAVYAVDVDVATGHVGEERRLFDGSYPAELGYDVMADGSRFLMVRADPRPEALPILVITNFFDEVRKKVGP